MKRIRLKSLRWRLIGAQMLVVVVGVITLALGLEVMLQRLDLTSWPKGLVLSTTEQEANQHVILNECSQCNTTYTGATPRPFSA